MLDVGAARKKLKKSTSGAKRNASKPADHAGELPRLKRILGQVAGIERMIHDRRYCLEILQQAKAARSALQAFESAILRTHLQGCVRSAIAAQDSFDAEKKIQEIIEVFDRQ